MQEFLTGLFTTVLTITVPILVRYFIVWIETKILKDDADLDAKYLKMAADAIATATLETTQTYVENLKGKNAFDKKAQEKALQMSIERAKEIMSKEVREYLEEMVGDINIYITSQIEALIAQQKVVAK